MAQRECKVQSSHMTSQVVLKPAPSVSLALPAEHGIPATGDLASKIIVSGFSCTALELNYALCIFYIKSELLVQVTLNTATI